MLSFGDDYRNFIDSHSESLVSPRQPILAPRRKKSQKDSIREKDEGSNSETEELNQLFDQISECKKEIRCLGDEFQDKKENGFNLEEDGLRNSFGKELQKCLEKTASLKDLVDIHSNNKTFVGRKLSREVRCKFFTPLIQVLLKISFYVCKC